MISVVVTTFNEAKKLENCLESLEGFADEKIIIDLESTDDIEKVAKKHQAKFIKHPKVEYVEKVRNFGISKANEEWVLILDPDEKITEDFKNKLKEIVEEDKYTAVNIPRKNIFFGKWIAHTNWWPDRHIRFFKKDKVKWSDVIHSYPKVEGDILELDAKENLAIIHEGYTSIKEFFERQNRYSTIDAQNKYDNNEKFSFWKMIWAPKREFLARYIKHQGFLDGFYGFALVLLMMIYQISVWIKVWELENKAKVR